MTSIQALAGGVAAVVVLLGAPVQAAGSRPAAGEAVQPAGLRGGFIIPLVAMQRGPVAGGITRERCVGTVGTVQVGPGGTASCALGPTTACFARAQGDAAATKACTGSHGVAGLKQFEDLAQAHEAR